MAKVSKEFGKMFKDFLVKGFKAVKGGEKSIVDAVPKFGVQEKGFGDDFANAWRQFSDKTRPIVDGQFQKNISQAKAKSRQMKQLLLGNDVPATKDLAYSKKIASHFFEEEGGAFTEKAFDSLVREGKFKDIHKMASDRIMDVTERAYLKRLTQESEVVLGGKAKSKAAALIGESEIDITMNKKNYSTRDKIREIENKQKLATDILMSKGELPKPSWLVEQGAKALTSVDQKIQNLWEMSNHLGLRNVSKSAMNLYDLTQMAPLIEAKTRALNRGASTWWAGVAKDENKAHAFMEYISQARFSDKNAMKLVPAGNKLNVYADLEVANAVGAKRGIKFTYEDFMGINKDRNISRQMQKSRLIWEQGSMDTSHLSDSYKDVPFDRVYNTELMTGGNLIGDSGANYFPAIPTKEFRAAYIDNNSSLKQQYSNASFSGRQKFFDKSRKEGSLLRSDPANMKPMHEAIPAYQRGMIDMMVKDTGDNILNEIYAGINLTAGKQPKTYFTRTAENIKKQWGYKFTDPRVYEEMSLVEKFFKGYADITIPLALSSPRMAGMNSLQAIFTGGMWSGNARTAKEQIRMINKHLTAFGKTVVGNEKNLAEITNNVLKGLYDKPYIKGFEGVEKKLFDKYIKNHPEFSRLVISDLRPEHNTLMGKYGDVLTTLFQVSDRLSRFVSFSSSAKHASKAYETFAKNMKTMTNDEAIGILAKDLHLKQFKGIERFKILDSINYKDLTKNENFLYNYSTFSVKSQIFDYSKYGSHYIKDKARAIHPDLARALTFTSWPMYYSRLLKGAFDSYSAGDRAPLLNLFAMGSAVYIGTSIAQEKLDDGYVKDLAKYAKGKTPGLAPLGLLEKTVSSPAGIYDPIFGAALGSMAYGLNSISGSIGVGERDAFSYLEQVGMRKAKGSIIQAKIEGLHDMYKQLAEEK